MPPKRRKITMKEWWMEDGDPFELVFANRRYAVHIDLNHAEDVDVVAWKLWAMIKRLAKRLDELRKTMTGGDGV